MNRCPEKIWNAILACAAILDEEEIRYRLIGTAALAAHGVEVEVPDADFLVENDNDCAVPEGAIVVYGREGAAPSGDAMSVDFDGVKLDYVRASDIDAEHYLDETALEIDGVNVAPADAVWKIKYDARRPKDVEHANQHGLAWASEFPIADPPYPAGS